jgi:hypothetical protein
LTAAGLNADALAQVVGVNKNTLRAEHALALASGRASLKKRKEEEAASALTREEQHAANAILMAFSATKWNVNGRNLLFRGTDGQGALSPPDAYAAWAAAGHGWITAGLDHNFSREQLQKFAELKAAAEGLRGGATNGEDES